MLRAALEKVPVQYSGCLVSMTVKTTAILKDGKEIDAPVFCQEHSAPGWRGWVPKIMPFIAEYEGRVTRLEWTSVGSSANGRWNKKGTIEV
jgi:hypothetical protein